MTNIEPYLADVKITFITVGNEIIHWRNRILRATCHAISHQRCQVEESPNLDQHHCGPVAMTNLGQSYPPSAGDFTPQALEQVTPVLKFLSQTSTPILVNIYPYAADSVNIQLDYAIFNTDAVVVQDGPLGYSNMFDVIFDAFIIWAMEKEGVKDLPMVTGWPSAGNGNLTTPDIASIYNGNFVKHVESGKGTSKRPNSGINGFLFATFNENQKPVGTEKNFGLYNHTNMKPIYKLF